MNGFPGWLDTPSAPFHDEARRAAEARQSQLTKPPGALGQLEALAIRLATMQGSAQPRAGTIHIAVFAADHGVAAEGVSAFPQVVTGEMVKNFAAGGAAISVLARYLGASLEVVNLGTVNDPGPLPGVVREIIAPSSANLAQEAAMSHEQLGRALEAGRASVERARKENADLYIGGEMGIANTTAAAALACALLDAQPEHLAGPGTGLDAAGVSRKAEVIRRALALHRGQLADPREALRRLGGFEIAALTGAYLAAAQAGLAVLVDGFIASAAALAAVRIRPDAGGWLLFSHASAEPGHRRILQALAATPLLDVGMRLGEGSGAAVAVPLLRLACALHNEMATFAEAGVSKQP